MSGVTQILDSIFQNNGGTTKQWRSANEILLTKTDEVKKYVSYIKNKIRDLNKNTQLLALDFLDYSIDDGKMPLWTQVGSKDFMQSLVNIYKTRDDEEVQTKILYLIKKWANKFQKYNTIIPNFSKTYNNLKENDVDFPNDEDSTYEKYLQGPGIQSGFGSGTQKNKDEKNSSKNKNYIKDINVDLRTSSYEKKYKRLVLKLDEWTQQIQDANVYIDLAKDGNFDDDLRGICNDLALGKKQLVDTIESGKLKDENLMEISLNVQDDIELTIKRWNNLKNGKIPEPFQSSFFRQRNNENDNNLKNDNNKNNDTDNNNQNKGGMDLLGFDDDFGGSNNQNNNINNNPNNANDLLDVFSGNQNSNQGNNFFGNMGNNNNSNNLFGNNNQNNNNTFGQNNNFFGNNSQNNNNTFGQNNNFFGNNNQNNSNQNNNNDLFSQVFNNSNNNMNNNNINISNNNAVNSNNDFNNLFQNNNNSFNNNNNGNQFGMNNSNNNNNFMNNQMNFANNNNNNNFGFNNNNSNFSNNNNFNFNALNNNNNNKNKNVSNKDFVFDF